MIKLNLITKLSWGFSAMILILSAGCLGISPGSSQVAQYYNLSMASGMLGSGAENDKAIKVGIESISIPSYLNHKEMVIRKNKNHFRYTANNLWAQSPRNAIAYALEKGVGMRLSGDSTVQNVPWTDGFYPDYLIEVSVEDFGGNEEGDVLLKLHWRILTAETGEKIDEGMFDLKDRVWGNKDYPELVAELSDGLTLVAAEIADALSAL